MCLSAAYGCSRSAFGYFGPSCYDSAIVCVYALKVVATHRGGSMVDSEVFAAAYTAHGRSVLRYATYSAGSSQAAEDIAAEAWARYLEKGVHVSADRVEAWLIRVTRNLCASHHREAAQGQRLLTRVADSTDPPADGWTQPEIWPYVRRLKEPERLVVYLRIVEERSFVDMAHLLGRTEGAVKMTFYRALERLRHEMDATPVPSVFEAVGGADDV